MCTTYRHHQQQHIFLTCTLSCTVHRFHSLFVQQQSKRRCGGGNPCEQCENRDISCAYSQRRMSRPRRRQPSRSHSVYLHKKAQPQSPAVAVAETTETGAAAAENNQNLLLLQQQLFEESPPNGNRPCVSPQATCRPRLPLRETARVLHPKGGGTGTYGE